MFSSSPILPSIFLVLIFTVFSCLVNANDSKSQSIVITDGPYADIGENELSLRWICKNAVWQLKISSNKLPFDFKQCQLSTKIDRSEFLPDNLIYQGDFPVAAMSDFHGQYDLMMALLTNNQIVNENGDWVFGQGHFVITGDVFDRGDKVTEILWFLYQLEQQAAQAGGKVHLLLGNHEVMVLNGDLRYLHPKYVEVANKLKQPFEQLYGKETILGKWLRSKSVLVKVNNMLFAHGGFHPSLAKEKRTLKEINDVFKANLVKAELDSPRTGWGKYLHKTDGPIWYRGYFKGDKLLDNGASSEEIDLLLHHFEIDYLIVGHTSQTQIETRYQGRVIAIDSSMKNGEYGEILLIKNGKIIRGNVTGQQLILN